MCRRKLEREGAVEDGWAAVRYVSPNPCKQNVTSDLGARRLEQRAHRGSSVKQHDVDHLHLFTDSIVERGGRNNRQEKNSQERETQRNSHVCVASLVLP